MISDRKVISDTVVRPCHWKSTLCAFHVVQRCKLAFISLFSDSHTKDLTHFSSGEKMYNSVVQHIAHPGERQGIFAPVHHSDVRGQSGFIYQNRKLCRLRAKPLADGDDEDLMGIENYQHGQAPSSLSLEEHVLQMARRDLCAGHRALQRYTVHSEVPKLTARTSSHCSTPDACRHGSLEESELQCIKNINGQKSHCEMLRRISVINSEDCCPKLLPRQLRHSTLSDTLWFKKL